MPMRPERAKEADMGGPPGWKYIPTPQAGELVEATICTKCGKRAKKPKVIKTQRCTREYLSFGCNEKLAEGLVASRGRWQRTRTHTTTRTIHSCCSRKTRTVQGRVIRSCWSKTKKGTVARFFLVVFVPETGRTHWATLETCKVIDPITALGNVIAAG
jgi:hypothetical protein